jgi:hypothetical protein
MLVLVKQTGLGNVACYQRPKTKEGFDFLEEQRKKLDNPHAYYYIWDNELKEHANARDYK